MRFAKRVLVMLALCLFVTMAYRPAAELVKADEVEDYEDDEDYEDEEELDDEDYDEDDDEDEEESEAWSINKSSLKLMPATSYDLEIEDYDDDIKWSSSNKKVAKVTKNGRVIAIAPGTANIKARDEDGALISKCNVTVAYGSKTYKGVKYKDVKDSTFGTVGRWFPYANSTFTNANGSIFYFRATGTQKVTINFVDKTSKKTPMYAYSINGKDLVRKSISSNVINLGGEGTYYVKVVIDSIATVENRFGGAGVGVKSIEPYNKSYGAVCGIEPQTNLIAFYGDSITEGVASYGASYYPDGCSATHSYAWYTAEKLGATPYICGYASTGVDTAGKVESIGKISFATASNAIRKYTSSKKVSKYSKDVKVVVLEYGTNDTTGGSLFQSKYNALIKQVHKAYPKATIICMTPFYKQLHAKEIKEAAKGLKYCKVFDTSGISISGRIDSLHPSDTCAKRNIAPKLAKFIKKNSKAF